MIPFECACEDDVLAAVGTGRWPDRVDADLRAHVDQCAICRDIVAVAVAFGAGETSSQAAGVRVPDSGVIWLRAQLRARSEAAKTATRPITVAQTLSFASVIGLFGMLLGASSAWLQTGVHWLAGLARAINPLDIAVPASLLTTLADHLTLVTSVSVLLLLMPIAVYLAMREPREQR